jgi:putative NADPH-quinone reductase
VGNNPKTEVRRIHLKISVILGHPYKKSFNHAIAETVVSTLRDNNHEVYFHDLYAEGFNPVMPVEELSADQSTDLQVIRHSREIKEADGIIVIHPNWWGQPPAMLKGWIDRVLRQEVAYTFAPGDNGGGLPIGLLKAKAGLVLNTSNTPEEREISVLGDPLEKIWRSCIFSFCGVPVFDRKMFRVVADSTEDDRRKWLLEVEELVHRYFPPR